MEAWGPRCTMIRAFTKRGKPKASSSMGENRHKVLRAHTTHCRSTVCGILSNCLRRQGSSRAGYFQDMLSSKGR